MFLLVFSACLGVSGLVKPNYLLVWGFLVWSNPTTCLFSVLVLGFLVWSNPPTYLICLLVCFGCFWFGQTHLPVCFLCLFIWGFVIWSKPPVCLFVWGFLVWSNLPLCLLVCFLFWFWFGLFSSRIARKGHATDRSTFL